MNNRSALCASIMIAALLTAVSCASGDPGQAASRTELFRGAAFRGPIQLPFTSQVRWAREKNSPETPISEIQIDGNRGHIVYRGKTLPAVLMAHLEFPESHLGGILATDSDNVIIVDVACKKTGSIWVFRAISLFDPDELIEARPAGSCTFSNQPAETLAEFTPFEAISPNRIAVTGYHIRGEAISVDDATGTGHVTLDGTTYELTLVRAVPSQRGTELYSLIRHDSFVGFIDVQLLADRPGVVPLAYGFRFDAPGFEPSNHVLPADWRISR